MGCDSALEPQTPGREDDPNLPSTQTALLGWDFYFMSNLDISLASIICWYWASWGKTSQASLSFVFVILKTSEKLTVLSFSLSFSI